MKKEKFLEDYYCKLSITNSHTDLRIVTEVIRRNNGAVVDGVETKINIRETNNWINDSQTLVSLNEWDWGKIVEEAKRAQLDYFSQRIPIEDYFPLDRASNASIDDIYK
tara:strand:+ start:712 stop:1038 length:327 start_codon:yes stop_codon:yes gene_type:complete